MASTTFVRCFAAVVVSVAVGCARDTDPRPIRIGDFSSDQKLRDTLSRLVPRGTPLSAAKSLMERSGFECGNRAGIVVNTTTDKLSSGKTGAPVLAIEPDLPGIQAPRLDHHVSPRQLAGARGAGRLHHPALIL